MSFSEDCNSLDPGGGGDLFWGLFVIVMSDIIHM